MALAVIIMAVVFILTRRRQRQLTLERETENGCKNSKLHDKARKDSIKPAHTVTGSSKEPVNKFNTQTTKPGEFSGSCPAKTMGRSELEDDAHIIPFCGWGHRKYDQMITLKDKS